MAFISYWVNISVGIIFCLRTSLFAGYVAPIKPDLGWPWYCYRFVYMFIIQTRRQHCYWV